MGKRICSLNDCERTARRNGWCSMHDQRLKRNGHFEKTVQPAAGLTCSHEECERPAWARTWCRFHYQRWRQSIKGRDDYLGNRYGLTGAEYDAMLDEQGHR